jgi:hypothetical protein
MRVWAQKVYGIPPEQVVGSTFKLKYELNGDKPTLTIVPEIALVDDKVGKPVGIRQFIGKRPVMCFGNSDGDHEMLQLTTIGRMPGFGLIVHHTDADRDSAYDAHQDDDTVRVADWDKSGNGKITASKADVKRPVCVKFVAKP